MTRAGRIIELDSYRLRKLIRKLRWTLRYGIIVRRNLRKLAS